MKTKHCSNNFIISKNTLEEDNLKCDFAIYRNSAAIFDSISYGLMPVYLKSKDNLNINPLYSILPKKFFIKSANDLKFIIKYKIKTINKKVTKF